MDIPPLYYRNRAGAIAVSVDDGDTLVLPNGRTIEVNAMWEETDPDEGALSEPQREAVRNVQVPGVLDSIVKNYSRGRKLASRDYGPGPEGRPIRRLSEDVLVVKADFD